MSCNCKTIVQNFHGGEVGPISACTGPISTYQINGCGNNQVSFFGKYTMPPSGGTAGQVLQYPSTGGTQLVWASDDQVSGGTLTDNCTASTQTLVLDLQDGTKLTITGNKDVKLDDDKYRHKGIAYRNFTRTFALADHIEVNGASVDCGILRVYLERVVPEELKPRKIEIMSDNKVINGKTEVEKTE